MDNLVESLYFTMQVRAPALRITKPRIKEVLQENNITDGTSFGKFYGYNDPIKMFIDDYLAYGCTIGFNKSKRS